MHVHLCREKGRCLCLLHVPPESATILTEGVYQ
jgi:hypothetical protein